MEVTETMEATITTVLEVTVPNTTVLEATETMEDTITTVPEVTEITVPKTTTTVMGDIMDLLLKIIGTMGDIMKLPPKIMVITEALKALTCPQCSLTSRMIFATWTASTPHITCITLWTTLVLPWESLIIDKALIRIT